MPYVLGKEDIGLVITHREIEHSTYMDHVETERRKDFVNTLRKISCARRDSSARRLARALLTRHGYEWDARAALEVRPSPQRSAWGV